MQGVVGKHKQTNKLSTEGTATSLEPPRGVLNNYIINITPRFPILIESVTSL